MVSFFFFVSSVFFCDWNIFYLWTVTELTSEKSYEHMHPIIFLFTFFKSYPTFKYMWTFVNYVKVLGTKSSAWKYRLVWFPSSANSRYIFIWVFMITHMGLVISTQPELKARNFMWEQHTHTRSFFRACWKLGTAVHVYWCFVHRHISSWKWCQLCWWQFSPDQNNFKITISETKEILT